MTSNFLGDPAAVRTATSLISTNELMAREGLNLQKGMNFRDEVMLSVFLVLPTHQGEYHDAWDAASGRYTFEGHDSTTVEAGGKAKDQLMMYDSGRLTDNGRFYKAAHAYKDGLSDEPLRIQVYEKIDAGVWFDKGIFTLVDARHVDDSGRMVFRFDLQPVGAASYERMLSVADKIGAWTRDKGQCSACGMQSGLCFVDIDGGVALRCGLHGGRSGGGGLLG